MKPKKKFRVLSIIVSIIGITLIDILIYGLDFKGIEVTVIPFLISSAIVFQRMVYKDYNNLKNRVLYSIYLGFLFSLYFVLSVTIYYIAINSVNDFSLKSVFILFLNFLPNSVARLILISPFIILLSILSSFIHRAPKQNKDNLQDSNV